MSEVYVLKERVKIVREVRQDYLIEDADTGKQYLIDQQIFKRKYATEADRIPVHQELWDKLEQQALELHQLKRANTRIRGELRSERKKRHELQKTLPKKEHYRNGQKRGRTMNG